MAYLWELGEGASHQPGRRREPHREAGKRRAAGAGRSGSEPARSGCGGGSLEAAQHSRTGKQGRPGGWGDGRRPATYARRPSGSRDGVPGSARLRLACRVSPPPRGRREETSREVRAARDFFFHAAYGGEQRGRSMSREAVAVALGLTRSQPSMDDPTAEVCRRRGPMICAIQGQVSSFKRLAS